MDKKILNNATIAYLFMGYFMLKKVWNQSINNDFVRSHAKSAVFLNSLMILVYFIFIWLWFLDNLYFLGIWLNHILASILIISLFITSFVWMHKAQNWKEFNIKYGTAKKADISFIKAKINEEEKVKLIVSLIPLLWKLLAKNDNSWIIHNKKISSLAYIIIFILILLNAQNSLFIFSLIYSIFLVFVGLNLFIRDELFIFWKKIPSLDSIRNYLIAGIKYILLIITWKFQNFSDILKNINTRSENTYEKEAPLKYAIYFPIINFIFLRFLKTKQRKHIFSWLILTFLSIIIYLIDAIPNAYQFIILYFIFVWLENIEDENYEMPFIYDILIFKKKPAPKS